LLDRDKMKELYYIHTYRDYGLWLTKMTYGVCLKVWCPIAYLKLKIGRDKGR